MAQESPKKLITKPEIEIKKDNTTIKKVLPNVEKIQYSYMGKDEKLKNKASLQDSIDYNEGFKEGLKHVKETDRDEKNKKWNTGLTWRGLNPRYNEGFSEGKDKSLSLKSMRSIK